MAAALATSSPLLAARLQFATAPAPNLEIAPGVFAPTVSLGTGAGSDPRVGLGPWLEGGGVGIDTALTYHTEADIADVLEQRGADRSKLFITTKVQGPGNACYGQLRAALAELRTLHADLVLLHSPTGASEDRACWAQLEQAVLDGLARAIGVSNFGEAEIEMLGGATPPAVNQCQFGVSLRDEATIEYCRRRGITYSTFGAVHACPADDATILGISETHNVTSYQVCMRYALDRGMLLAVGVGEHADHAATHVREDLGLEGFALTDAELDAVNRIEFSTPQPPGDSASGRPRTASLEAVAAVAAVVICAALGLGFWRWGKRRGAAHARETVAREPLTREPQPIVITPQAAADVATSDAAAVDV